MKTTSSLVVLSFLALIPTCTVAKYKDNAFNRRLRLLGYSQDEIKKISKDPDHLARLAKIRKLRMLGYTDKEIDKILRYPGYLPRLIKIRKLKMRGCTEKEIDYILNGYARLSKRQLKHYQRIAFLVSCYDSIVARCAKKNGIDAVLIKAIMIVESNGDTLAVSKAGAKGLMQLMDNTSLAYGVDDPFNPRKSIEGASKFLKDLTRVYEDDLNLILAAYNAGPGAVDRHNGIPRYPETRHYVNKVKSIMGMLTQE